MSLARLALPLAVSAAVPTATARVPPRLAFERNCGQAEADATFLLRGKGELIRIGAGFLVLDDDRGSSLRLTVEEPCPGMEAVGLDELPGRVNVYVGSDPAEWVEDAPTYARVAWPSVRPGVDLVLLGSDAGGLELDLVVAPGARPEDVVLRFAGAADLDLSADGALVAGALALGRPVAWQEGPGGREPVAVGFELVAPDRALLRAGAFDPRRPLVVDPTLAYSSYLGGTGSDHAPAVAIDPAGEILIVGTTSSTDFPTRNPAQGPTLNSSGFVAKLDPSGTSLVYATYVGGSEPESCSAVASDATGAAYVTGHTASANFPVLTPVDPGFGGGPFDGFVLKLDSGGRLVWSSFLGGSFRDAGEGVGVDASGNCFVAGYTESSNFPVRNAWQPRKSNLADAFLAEIDPTGRSFVFSTFLGGNAVDEGLCLTLLPGGGACLAGHTWSTDFPVTPNVFQPAPAGDNEVFLSCFDAAGGLSWSSYLGGTLGEVANGIAADASGAVVVTGVTDSVDFPLRNPIQGTLGTPDTGFIARLGPGGSTLDYSTFFGGSGSTRLLAVAVDAAGSARVTGYTSSSDLQVLDPVQSSSAGGNDALAARLDPAGGLLWSSYLGGTGDEYGYSAALDASGSLVLAGYTRSTDFPLASPFQAALAGSNDIFVARIADATCARPGPVGNTLRLARAGGGSLAASWIDVAPATSYAVLDDDRKTFTSPRPFASAPSGQPGLLAPLPPEPLLYFRVAGVNACGTGPF